MSWWNEITKFEQISYIIATASSVVLLVYTVLSMLGFEKSKADDELKLVSFRNFLSLLAVGAWLTIVFYKAFKQVFISLIISVIGALALVILVNTVSRIFLKKYKTTEIDPASTVGLTGTVYESIPKKESGKGRVIIEIGGEMKVFPATSKSEKKLTYGSIVKIIKVIDDKILLVEVVTEE